MDFSSDKKNLLYNDLRLVLKFLVKHVLYIIPQTFMPFREEKKSERKKKLYYKNSFS